MMVPVLDPPPVRARVPVCTSVVPRLLNGTAIVAVPGGAVLRTVPALLKADALAKKLLIPAESGSTNRLPARLFHTAALAKVNVCPAGMVAVPALFTVRPSIFEKNPPDRVDVPFRLVAPVPDMIPPVQVRRRTR